VLNELKEVIKYRELLVNLVMRDMKVRYKNSVLGFFWSLINPLMQVATITVVFKYILGVRIPNYSAYLLCAFLPWTFFQMSILDASSSVLSHAGLVKKTYFPREILPISIVISNLIHFVLALVVFFIYLLVLGTPILSTWLILPVLVITQFFLNVGVALFVSSLNVFYEDIKYLATVLLNLLFYLTPVIYMVEQPLFAHRIPETLRPWVFRFYFWNPLSYLITAYRKILLPPFAAPGIKTMPLDYRYLLLAMVTSIVVFLVGYAFYNKRKWLFAERL